MEGLKPELTSFLREAMIRKASNLNSSEDGIGFSGSSGLSGLAGLASIAGGFDQILLAAGGSGVSLPEVEVIIYCLYIFVCLIYVQLLDKLQLFLSLSLSSVFEFR